jgi:hypothetical protein
LIEEAQISSISGPKETELNPMTIEEKVREIVLSEELSSAEKLDCLHALIPGDSCKIDNLSQATPARLVQLKDGLAVTQAMQELRAELLTKNKRPRRKRQ